MKRELKHRRKKLIVCAALLIFLELFDQFFFDDWLYQRFSICLDAAQSESSMYICFILNVLPMFLKLVMLITLAYMILKATLNIADLKNKKWYKLTLKDIFIIK